MLDLQPISLTRLLDRLADNGLIERRADPNDRRANRLYLKPAAQARCSSRLAELGADMMETVLDGLDAKSIDRMLKRTRHAEGQPAPRHQPPIAQPQAANG